MEWSIRNAGQLALRSAGRSRKTKDAPTLVWRDATAGMGQFFTRGGALRGSSALAVWATSSFPTDRSCLTIAWTGEEFC